MADTTDLWNPSPDPREARVAELETQLRQRDALIEQLQQQLAELKQRLADLERAAKRHRSRGSGGKRSPSGPGVRPDRGGSRRAPGRPPTK